MLQALVIGDLMLDLNLYGHVRRLSPEGPFPIFNSTHHAAACGGAGNVAANLSALGVRVQLAGLVGHDKEADLLLNAVRERGMSDSLIRKIDASHTITKTRIWAEGTHQMLRIDDDGDRKSLEAASADLWAQASRILPQVHAVIIADYDKGTITNDVAEQIVTACREHDIFCIVDSKRRDFQPFSRATLLAPNLAEVERALGQELPTFESAIQAARHIRQTLELEHMLITLGARGMALATEAGCFHIPADAREVADVTGAGDTVVAALTAALCEGQPIEAACRFASRAAAIAVSHRGTYVVSRAELDQHAVNGTHKVAHDWTTARQFVNQAQRQGKKVVFTNGCFDILHAGHLSCLQQARALGDLLVVGLNSDRSVKQLKGADRPVNHQADRAALLAGLACVDLVVVFDEATPEKLIQYLIPDILVKGGDYDPLTMAGSEFIRSRGGTVVTIPLLAGRSTTRILAHQAKGAEVL